MIGVLVIIIGLLLLVIGLVMASRTHNSIIAELGEFIGICGCLILIGMIAFYGISFSLEKLQ